MTYSELYRWAENRLESKFDAAQLFTHVTAKKAFHLPFDGDNPATDRESALLRDLCERRAAGEPLQYLLGEWEFYGLPFKVGKGVLIPRADTETLVDVALELIRDIPVPEVVDLGSGSGCVAISLQHERKDASVTAVELSGKAIEYLRKNVVLNESPIHVVNADMWEYRHPRPLDLIVTNPPYIPRETIATLQPEVLHEPVRALDGGMDGMDFYRAIIRRYHTQMAEGGWICMEVGIGQSDKVRQILETSGFTDTAQKEDLSGIPRVVYARNKL